MPKNQGSSLSAIVTKLTYNMGDVHGLFTFLNDGGGSVFVRQQDGGRTFAGTAAEINALGGGEIKAGGNLTVKGVAWDYVCGSDTGLTATVRVLPGVVGSNFYADVNMGANVGLLDTAENEIDPAIKSIQLERHLEIEGVNGADILDWDKHVDLATLASSVLHIPHNDHTTSIQIEKTGATVKTALMSRDDIAVDASGFEGPLQLSWAVRGTNWTGVDYIVLRIGTGASHYMEWKVDPADFSTTNWVKLASAFIDATQTGTGLDMSAITYIALGVEMSAAGTATAAAIQFDFVHFLSAPYATPSTAIVIDVGNVSNTVRVQKFGLPSNANVATDAGASNSGTQRTISATDDPGVVDLAALEVLSTAANVDLAAIEVLLGTIDSDTGAAATDLAAIEVLITAGNVDLAALETLITAGNVDLAAVEVLLGTIDADTGAAATDLAAIEVLIAAGNVDLAAIEVLLGTIDGDTGNTATATGNRDEVLSVMYRITVDQATDVFANQGGAALPALTTSIALIPEDDTNHITFALGAASSGSARLPATGIVIPITKTNGDLVQMWISSGTEYVTLLVYVPR